MGEAWKPLSLRKTTWWSTNDYGDMTISETIHRRNVRALALADEADADALRRAREFRPEPLAP